MAFITLICPHCGGDFELDPGRSLQPYWICPYCGNRSIMQKNESSIRLRGIISGKTSLTTYTPSAQTPPSKPPEALSPEIDAPTPGPVPAEAAEPLQNGHNGRSLADFIAEAVAEPAQEPPQEPPQEPAQEPSLSAVLFPVLPPTAKTQNNTTAENEPVESEPARARATGKPSDHTFERLCKLAEDAAKKRDLPLFNSYSRQAIDLDPTDPRMYAWRAILTEEAAGFAMATWTLPYWPNLSPLRKQTLIAQHFYNFSTALQFSQPSHRQDLISQITKLIIRQAVDHFNERAALRCSQNLIFKKFRGRYKRSDLAGSEKVIDALRNIVPKAFPVGLPELAATLRIEIRLLPPRILRCLKKY